jgi:hypothetical protein
MSGAGTRMTAPGYAVPGPSSSPGSTGLDRVASGPVADYHVHRRNRMRSLPNARAASSHRHRRAKTLSPELAGLLARYVHNAATREDRDAQRSSRSVESSSAHAQVRLLLHLRHGLHGLHHHLAFQIMVAPYAVTVLSRNTPRSIA